MFWACFTYNYKGPCYIYYPKTEEQKDYYEEQIETLDETEIKEELRAAFAEQEAKKEVKWTAAGKKFPTRRALWEVFWNNYQQKRDSHSRGGVNNIRYTYKVIKPLLIPFYHEIMAQRQSSE